MEILELNSNQDEKFVVGPQPQISGGKRMSEFEVRAGEINQSEEQREDKKIKEN